MSGAPDDRDGFHTGRLLVAAPELTDPNFARAVVLVLDHDGDGALGVVLNRPSSIEVASVLPGWDEIVSAPDVVFRGGPVATDSALGVAEVGAQDDDPVGFRAMFSTDRRSHDTAGSRATRTGLVDLDTPLELIGGALDALRVFAGYAGWGAGQLEQEIDDGGWFVLDADPGDLRGPVAERLWSSVLRRQRGELALLSTYPADPAMN